MRFQTHRRPETVGVKMARTIWRPAVSGTVLLLMACSEASATYVGDRYFVSTLVTTVPTPADFANIPHVVVLPEVGETRETDVPFTFSKLITKDWSILFTETLRSIDDAGDTRTGFDDLVIGTQYVLYSNDVHQSILAVGGTAALGGTGSSEIDAAAFSTFTPTIYLGKGFGDLPDSLGWLQPVTITANLGVALPTSDATTTAGSRPSIRMSWIGASRSNTRCSPMSKGMVSVILWAWCRWWKSR